MIIELRTESTENWKIDKVFDVKVYVVGTTNFVVLHVL